MHDSTLQTAFAHHTAGNLAAAEALYLQILKTNPRHADALHLLGMIALKTGRVALAEQLITQAIANSPRNSTFHINLALVHTTFGRFEAAERESRIAIEIEPTQPVAHFNLGRALSGQHRPEAAVHAYRASLRVDPTNADTHNNLAMTLKEFGMIDQAWQHMSEAAQRSANDPVVRSNFLYLMHFLPQASAADLGTAHRQWSTSLGPQRREVQLPVTRSTPSLLRIGYVSADFREHPVMRFFLPLLRSHDRSRFHITLFSNTAVPDSQTEEVRSLADSWCDISGINDPQAFEQIRTRQIDILVDLSGHTGGNRLPVFARRAAPVQVTWLGYPDTTGLSEMDYRLTDAIADPQGLTDAHCSERLLRLPETAWCYEPKVMSDMTPLPAIRCGEVTFGSFNNLAKLNAQVARLWSQVLARVPGSKLLIKAAGLGSATAQSHIRSLFTAAGVADDRLVLHPPRDSYSDHMGVYGMVDIALDTFPYNGTTTTCDALWMGVPVVTLRGQTHMSRVSSSLLHSVGLDQLCTDTPEAFIQTSTELAADREALSQLRATLRSRMQGSPLMNTKRFARSVEDAFEQMWNQKATTKA